MRPRIKRKHPDYLASKNCYNSFVKVAGTEKELIPIAREMQSVMRDEGIKSPFEMAKICIAKLSEKGKPDWYAVMKLRATAFLLTGDHIKQSFNIL